MGFFSAHLIMLRLILELVVAACVSLLINFDASPNVVTAGVLIAGPAIADHYAVCPVNFSDNAHRRPAATGSMAWGKIFETPGIPRVSPQSLGP
jgi:hypothetical protein